MSTEGTPPTSTVTASPSTAGLSAATSATSGPKTWASSFGTSSCPATADYPMAPSSDQARPDPTPDGTLGRPLPRDEVKEPAGDGPYAAHPLILPAAWDQGSVQLVVIPAP